MVARKLLCSKIIFATLPRFLPFDALWFVPVLLLVIRPVSVWLGLIGTRTQRRLIAWFGGRGSGSIYYLMYAIEHGLDSRPPSG
jgi:NhaP-type Na+/H+ and K+/H+ antiporter